jgi:hypothetical protein
MAQAARIKDLERAARELRKSNEILKLASAFFAQAELDRFYGERQVHGGNPNGCLRTVTHARQANAQRLRSSEHLESLQASPLRHALSDRTEALTWSFRRQSIGLGSRFPKPFRITRLRGPRDQCLVCN